MRVVTLVFMMCWPMILFGQHSFFIDSLFSCEYGGLGEAHKTFNQARISQLKRDKGISLGLTTSTFQDDLTSGWSSRLVAKTGFLANGLKDRKLQIEMLEKQGLVDSLEMNEEDLASKYGLYYDYIIYLFNQEKKELIDELLMQVDTQKRVLTNLFYQRLVDYDQIRRLRQTRDQFETIGASHETYNAMLKPILDTLDLPIHLPESWVSVDFKSISNDTRTDTVNARILAAETDIIDLKYRAKELPQANISLGYDILRNRPYLSIGLSKKIGSNTDKVREAEKAILLERQRAGEAQYQKELLNYQYEYDYKLKQYHHLQHDLISLTENITEIRTRQQVLSLENSIDEARLRIDSLMVRYEMLDLEQQALLILLQVKNKFPRIILGHYTTPLLYMSEHKKYQGKRYVLVDPETSIDKDLLSYLRNNELTMVRMEELGELANLFTIDPTRFETRLAMEQAIDHHLAAYPEDNLLFENIESIRQLDLGSIRQQNNQTIF